MNIPKAYIGGFQKAAKAPRMLFILYFANILTALILALAFNNELQKGFGQSGMVSNLLQGFDYTAFTNLMHYNGDGIMALVGGIKWLVIAYFLLNVFTTGGIIRTLNKEKFTTNAFFAGSAYNFFRFLGVSLIMVLVQVVFALLVYIPTFLLIGNNASTVESEVTLYVIFLSGFVLHLLLFLLISMIGDYAKFYLVLNDSFNIFNGFWKGVRYVFKHFLKTYFLYLFLLFIPAVVMYIYLYLEKDIKMATGLGILIVFALQQGFILLRVFLRIWVIASQFKMYSDDFIKSSTVQNLIFSVVDTKIDEKEEKVLEEEQQTVKETETKSEYAIDFNKTFTSDDENNGERTITEEEMLKKVEEEEALERNKNATELSSDDFDEDDFDDEEDEEDENEDHDEIIEKVEQNVVASTEPENEEHKEKEEKPDDDIIEFEL